MNILHFIYGLNVGGAESFLKNLVSSMSDDNQFSFYYAIQNPNVSNSFFRQFINTDKILRLPRFPNHPLAQYRVLRKIIIQSKIDLIHVHVNSLVNPIPLLLAKSLKVPVVVHSHNSSNAMGGALGRLLHKTNQAIFIRDEQIKVACSELAGRWMFGRFPFHSVPNSVDEDRFQYNAKYRNEIRSRFKIGDETNLIGIIGRLHTQKNHKRGVDIFKEFIRKYPNSKLIVIGDGPEREAIESYIKEQTMEDSIILAGNIDDVAPYYSAIDILLMPSHFEGLPVVGVEAQVSGLPILASDKVSEELKIASDVKFLSLSDENSCWVDSLMDLITNSNEQTRTDAYIQS